MKTTRSILLVMLVSLVTSIMAQVAINTDGSQADSSAILDLKSTTGGLLLPRMNTLQLERIANPVAGLLVFNTDSSDIYGFNGLKWISFWNAGDTINVWTCGTINYGGQAYNTVIIGMQCWMAENLNIGTMINGSQNMTEGGGIEKYCYDDTTGNCETYGGLYQWNEMMNYDTTEGTQGICPPGWHIPTNEEWKQLLGEVDSMYDYPDSEWNIAGYQGHDAGLNLKSTSGWNSGGNGTDLFGFTVLPAGIRDLGGSFVDLGDDCHYWTSKYNTTLSAWGRMWRYSENDVNYNYKNKPFGLSVRCLKN